MTRPLPATIRAIEAGVRPHVVWTEITQAEFEQARDDAGQSNAVLGAALTDVEIGGVAYDVAVEPLRICPGYLWSLVRVEGGHLMSAGYSPTLAEAKAAAEADAVAVTATILAAD